MPSRFEHSDPPTSTAQWATCSIWSFLQFFAKQYRLVLFWCVFTGEISYIDISKNEKLKVAKKWSGEEQEIFARSLKTSYKLFGPISDDIWSVSALAVHFGSGPEFDEKIINEQKCTRKPKSEKWSGKGQTKPETSVRTSNGDFGPISGNIRSASAIPLVRKIKQSATS